MKNYIRFEILNLLSKKNIITFISCALLLCALAIIEKNNYEKSSETYINELTLAEELEQSNVDILTYNLKHNYNNKNERELKYWQTQVELTQDLKYSYINQDTKDILSLRLKRNKNILDGLNNRYINQFNSTYNTDEEDLIKEIKIDDYNLKNGHYNIIHENKPTSIFYLKSIQNNTIYTILIFLLIIALNSNLWSKEFSKSQCYQLIFSFPAKRCHILLTRNIIQSLFTLVCIVFLILFLCFIGYCHYGYGAEYFILSNTSIQNINDVLILNLFIFLLSMTLYIQLTQFLSLVLKDELMTCLILIIIILVSSFIFFEWNPFSYFNSYNLEHPFLKMLVLLMSNTVFVITNIFYITHKDLGDNL